MAGRAGSCFSTVLYCDKYALASYSAACLSFDSPQDGEAVEPSRMPSYRVCHEPSCTMRVRKPRGQNATVSNRPL